MRRLIDNYLQRWKNSAQHKPLLLRGARQVGKTHAVRQLGKTFDEFVEINFELQTDALLIFERDPQPQRIVMELSLLMGKRITPGSTLLFFDEVQAAPRALLALRYFWELLPELHIVAAGSLFDFTTEPLEITVGRVILLHMYPMSFLEFLWALNQDLLAHDILHHTLDNPLSAPIHRKLLVLLGQYLAIGGMPEVVKCWSTTQDPHTCLQIHTTLIDTYRQDFGKCGTKFQIKYLDLLFDQVPLQVGHKFKYSKIEGEYRKRELAPCLELLTAAGVIHRVVKSAGNGMPIGAEADPHDFKVIFLDVALRQATLGLDLRAWFINPVQQFINKGKLVEAFVGQELMAYADSVKKANLYYWHRGVRGSEAEIDYISQVGEHIIPIEAKSGAGTTLKSMHSFLQTHNNSPYGIRFSTNHYSRYEKIHSYPLYAIAKVFYANNQS
jgi:uncharacterized protein